MRNYPRTLKRKLPFEVLCRTILSMSGQSLHVELQRQFHYEPAAATAPAFVQQRRKLRPSVFEDILRRFTFRNRPKQQWNGYTLLAVDGSHVQIPSDIHDKATCLFEHLHVLQSRLRTFLTEPAFLGAYLNEITAVPVVFFIQ